MDLLRKDDLRKLMEESAGACVSIYIPTHRAGAEVRQDPIRLKNQLRQAEQRLIESGMRPAEAKELLESAHKLCENSGFWQFQGDGLAIFCAAQTFHHYRLPLQFDELVVVADRFHTKPLLQLLASDGHYYLLALSKNGTRLLQCTRFGVREVTLPASVPESLDAMLQLEGAEKNLQVRTSGASAIFHGHGAGTDEVKLDLANYFRRIDKGLHEVLRDERAPLVLAGVDYLLPLYKEANTYPNLLEDGVTGSPEGLRAEELRDKSWQVMESYFLKAQEEAAEHYRESLGSSRASKNIREVVPAAYQGRVDLLFVANGLQQWGSFDPETHKVRISRQQKNGDQDLLDLAASQTFVHGGKVHAVDPPRVPEQGPLAAVFRY